MYELLDHGINRNIMEFKDTTQKDIWTKLNELIET